MVMDDTHNIDTALAAYMFKKNSSILSLKEFHMTRGLTLDIPEDRANSWRIEAYSWNKTIRISHGAFSKHNTWKLALRTSEGKLRCRQCGREAPKWLMLMAWTQGINTIEYTLKDKAIYPEKAYEEDARESRHS